MAWLEYLHVCDVDARDTLGGPMRCSGGSCKFNADFDFCQDCDDEYRELMAREGRCAPAWLKLQAP